MQQIFYIHYANRYEPPFGAHFPDRGICVGTGALTVDFKRIKHLNLHGIIYERNYYENIYAKKRIS